MLLLHAIELENATSHKWASPRKNPAFGVNDQAWLNLDLSATVGSRMMNSFMLHSYSILHSADHDQTVRMRKLVCAFVVNMQQNQDFSQWGSSDFAFQITSEMNACIFLVKRILKCMRNACYLVFNSAFLPSDI